MRKSSIALAFVVAASPMLAQQAVTPPESRAERFMRNCDGNGDRDREQFCEVHDLTLKAPQRSLFVDGRENGSVRVYWWDKIAPAAHSQPTI